MENWAEGMRPSSGDVFNSNFIPVDQTVPVVCRIGLLTYSPGGQKHPHFTDGETKALRGESTFSRSHSKEVERSGTEYIALSM
jgi:hypothetical protein